MKFFNTADKVIRNILIFMIATQATILIASVFFRYVLHSPILWGDEVVRYLLIYITFVGTALATKDNKEIVVDVIDLVLSPTAQKVLHAFVDVIKVGFMLIFLYYGAQMAAFQKDSFGETLYWLSFGYIYISIPIGGVLTIFYIISKYFVREPKQTESL